MFDSQEKEGLFTEIDELIFTEDIPVYNSLVFQTGQLFERFIEGRNQNQGCENTGQQSLRYNDTMIKVWTHDLICPPLCEFTHLQVPVKFQFPNRY